MFLRMGVRACVLTGFQRPGVYVRNLPQSFSTLKFPLTCIWGMQKREDSGDQGLQIPLELGANFWSYGRALCALKQ